MTKLERAYAAEQCLDYFVHLTGPDLTMQEAAGDLIANIGHYCQSADLDYLSIIKTGIGHWTVEQKEPDGLDSLPDVTITINQ